MAGRLPCASAALHSLLAAPGNSGEGVSATPWEQRAGSCGGGAWAWGGVGKGCGWGAPSAGRGAAKEPGPIMHHAMPPAWLGARRSGSAHIDEAGEAVGSGHQVPLPAADAGCVPAPADAVLGAGAGVAPRVHRRGRGRGSCLGGRRGGGGCGRGGRGGGGRAGLPWAARQERVAAAGLLGQHAGLHASKAARSGRHEQHQQRAPHGCCDSPSRSHEGTEEWRETRDVPCWACT